MNYSMAATVKAMKIQEVILRAISGEIFWYEAADIIGVSYRSMKRWKQRYEEHGYDGLFDRRAKRPSPKRVPLKELETILKLYREKYMGFNIKHFHEYLREGHDIRRSYTFVKTALQEAGLIPKKNKKTKHRKKRPRRPLPGMMLHIDGSPHHWIPALPNKEFDLVVLMDDATSRVYDMELVPEEDTLSCMKLLKNCISRNGIFCSLYSDRASHFFHTPKAGDRVNLNNLTQIGRALTELGITPIPSYSPQGRGRSERMNRTLQDRLINEFKLNNIKTLEQANHFIKKVFLPKHNKRFTVKPTQKGSAFIPLPKHFDLDLIFSIKQSRTVRADNTVSFQNMTLQIEPSSLRCSFAKTKVVVHQHLDKSLSITFGPHVIGKYDSTGCHFTKKLNFRKAA